MTQLQKPFAGACFFIFIPCAQTAIRQMQRTLTLIDMVSNALTISDAKLFLGSNFTSNWTEFREDQATLERRSVDMRLVRLSMLIGRPMT